MFEDEEDDEYFKKHHYYVEQRDFKYDQAQAGSGLFAGNGYGHSYIYLFEYSKLGYVISEHFHSGCGAGRTFSQGEPNTGAGSWKGHGMGWGNCEDAGAISKDYADILMRFVSGGEDVG